MKIGIVGAGITGLALARALEHRAGLVPLVFEADDEPGGVIRSIRIEGRVLELGPQRTRLTAPIASLVHSLGLDDELITAPPDLPLWVFHAGRLRRVPFSLRDAATTDLLSWRGKARALLEPFADQPRDHESVADFLRRAFGREPYERMLGPLYGGLYASDPDDMLARLTIRPALDALDIRGSLLIAFARRSLRAADVPPACSFRTGLQSLTRALARSLDHRVRLGSAVRAIDAIGAPHSPESDDAGSPNPRFALRLDGDESVRVDRVVFTTPADATAALLDDIDPDAARRLRRLRYNPLAIVHLVSPDAHRLFGLGCQVSLAERMATRGITWNASLFPDADRDDLFTAFLGGARRPEIVDAPDTRIADAATEEFRRITGADARVLHVARTRMPAWDRSWTATEGLELPDGVLACANWESRAGIPGRIAAAERLAEGLREPRAGLAG